MTLISFKGLNSPSLFMYLFLIFPNYSNSLYGFLLFFNKIGDRLACFDFSSYFSSLLFLGLNSYLGNCTLGAFL